MKAKAILIAGPTASGKSALAAALAHATGGVVVNADSMQVYRDLRIITARPTAAEEAGCPHRLYGHVDAAQNYSVGRYLEDCARELTLLAQERRTAIVVGGTGLYFKALTEGLSDLPPVPEAVRAAVRARSADKPAPVLHAELAACDPLTAAKLRPSDPQRILRALEIFEATGRPLAALQGARSEPVLAAGAWRGFFLAPEREAGRVAIDARFRRMIEEGALAEVARLAERGLARDLPALRAHGVPHLLAYLEGRLTLDAAIKNGQADTRAYAKRQTTFTRHQLPLFDWVAPDVALDRLLA